MYMTAPADVPSGLRPINPAKAKPSIGLDNNPTKHYSQCVCGNSKSIIAKKCRKCWIGDHYKARPWAGLRNSERYQHVLKAGICVVCETNPQAQDRSRCINCIADLKQQTRSLHESGKCVFCRKHLDGDSSWRCNSCLEKRRAKYQPRLRISAGPMIRQYGTFLNEDLAQERALAELEGRQFNIKEFYKNNSPYKEKSSLDSTDRYGRSKHDTIMPYSFCKSRNPVEDSLIELIDNKRNRKSNRYNR